MYLTPLQFYRIRGKAFANAIQKRALLRARDDRSRTMLRVNFSAISDRAQTFDLLLLMECKDLCRQWCASMVEQRDI